jgi:hypothetical protein
VRVDGGGKEQSHACIANIKHGKPLTPDERKHAICEYIKLHVDHSNYLIAGVIGCSEGTIRKHRQQLEADGVIKPQESRLGKDGKERTNPTTTQDYVVEQTQLAPDPFDSWFSERVIQGDTLEILQSDQLRYDLAIVDQLYDIMNGSTMLSSSQQSMAFPRLL